MTTSQKQTSPVTIWCCGLALILLWLAISGHSMNQYLQKEQAQYAHNLGEDNARWILKTGHQCYSATFVQSGLQDLLLERTTPDRQMGEGLATTIEFFQSVVKNFLRLMQQLFYRIAVLLTCFPFWSIMLVAAIIDGLLIRKIRYHDFHYTSPLKNHWSRRASKWVPGIFLFLVIIPLPIPVLLFPAMGGLTALCFGWWAANWQKKV